MERGGPAPRAWAFGATALRIFGPAHFPGGSTGSCSHSVISRAWVGGRLVIAGSEPSPVGTVGFRARAAIMAGGWAGPGASARGRDRVRGRAGGDGVGNVLVHGPLPVHAEQ